MNDEQDERGNASSVPALVAGLSDLQSILVGTDAIDEVVWETAMLAVRASEAVDECGVTVLREGQPRSLYPDRGPHSALEEYQYNTDLGPAIDAIRSGRQVLVENTAGDTQWGGYAARAEQEGVRSTLSLPLVAGEQVLGAIHYYSTRTNAFPADFLLGRLVADLAATGLWCMLKHADRQQMNEQLQQALTSRAEIDQAKGILMAQQHCGPEEAFDLLRRGSQNRNVKLRDLATQIVRNTPTS